MVEVQESPAVPPFDPQGDVRFGYFAAGGILIALGWGLGVVANLLLHYLAPSGGHWVYRLYFGPAMGPYAWAVLGLGLVAGAFGTTLVALGQSAPRGPVVLPGYGY